MSPALLAGLTAAVVAAYVEHNRVPPAAVPALLRSVHAGLSALAARPTSPASSLPAADRGRRRP